MFRRTDRARRYARVLASRRFVACDLYPRDDDACKTPSVSPFHDRVNARSSDAGERLHLLSCTPSAATSDFDSPLLRTLRRSRSRYPLRSRISLSRAALRLVDRFPLSRLDSLCLSLSIPLLPAENTLSLSLNHSSPRRAIDGARNAARKRAACLEPLLLALYLRFLLPAPFLSKDSNFTSRLSAWHLRDSPSTCALLRRLPRERRINASGVQGSAPESLFRERSIASGASRAECRERNIAG